MAKIESLFSLSGSIGDITFVKSRNGFYAKRKSTISRRRLANDPSFQRLRENSEEFSRAAKAGKLLRDSIQQVLRNAKDSKTASRLSARLLKIIKQDRLHISGKREILPENIGQLEGFSCNVDANTNVLAQLAYEINIDRAAGSVEIAIPSFIQENSILYPQAANSCRLVTAVAALNFDANISETSYAYSDMIAAGESPAGGIILSNKINPGSCKIIFIFLGANFFEVTNGVANQIQNASFKPLTLIKVSVN